MTCGLSKDVGGSAVRTSAAQLGKRRTLKDVGPDEVHEVEVRVLVAEAGGAEREVLDDRRSRLTVNEVAVGESVLEAGDDAVDVVLAHLANVLEQERHRL